MPRICPPPQAGHRAREVASVLAVGGSRVVGGKRAVAAAAVTARSWRQRVSLSWRVRLAKCSHFGISCRVVREALVSYEGVV
jgi:hypothetical protein